RLQTATRGRSSDALFYVSRLVARGHNLLYRQRGQTLREIGSYVTTTVPGEVRHSWRQIALAAALLFLPAIASYTAVVHDPSVAARLLPDEMLSRANTGAERERRHEGYVTIPELMRPVVASQIIANNVQVTYVTFAMGLTAGIGTVLLLVFNGVAIGSAVGLFASKGIAHLILAFVAPHGVLELSAVCIAGGGGLLLAQAMVLPGNRPRREALVENGKRAITLIAASTLFLLVAGTLEGLVSPRVWPIGWKVTVSATTAVLMLGYLSLGRSARLATAPRAP
ncbi:MAG TPA: stage II sporulation protein M, partial [Candidatus Elarobacter sp.]|nr:stage II sporulation protein M [Candidatus Elarobacter sp.]